jgi:hypothetical protein
MLRVYAISIVARVGDFGCGKWGLTINQDAHASVCAYGFSVNAYCAVAVGLAFKRPQQAICVNVCAMVIDKLSRSARHGLAAMFLTIAPHLVIMSAAQGLFVGNLFAPRNFTRRLRLCQIVVSVKIAVTMPAGIVLRTQAYCHYLVVAISNATRRLRHVIWSPDGNC